MKKLLVFLFFTLGSSLFTLSNAQYSVLYNFAGPAGKNPFGALTFSASGNVLYGMASEGGAHSDGCIFSMNIKGSNYKDIFDFNGTNGASPQGSLVLSGNLFYAMTSTGGANGKGCIFSIDSNGNNYTDLLDFNDTDGANPQDNVFISGTTMYGMTLNGGANGDGLIFSIQTNGSGYVDLMDFNRTNGAHPHGSLIMGGNILYGMASSGGAHDSGCVFSIHTDGSGYADLHDFNQHPTDLPTQAVGSLVLSGKMLYGLAESGNSNARFIYSYIFKMDTNGNSYGYNEFGFRTLGSLIQLDNILFGTSVLSGPLNGLLPGGDILVSDTNLAGYTYLYNWDYYYPVHGLEGGKALTASPSKSILYGMTTYGGANSKGVIFKYVLLSATTSVTTVPCYNGNNGIATVTASGSYSPFHYLWSPGGDTTATITGLSAGTYTVTVTNSIGSKVTDTLTVTQSAPPFRDSVSYQLNVGCNGGNGGQAKIGVKGGLPPMTYLWAPGGQTTALATGLSAGTYSVTISNSGGCSVLNITITQPAPLSDSIVSITPPLCNGGKGSATVGVSGGTMPYTYTWTGGLSTTATCTRLVAGSYTVSIKDNHGCSASAIVITVTQPLALRDSSVSSAKINVSCNGGTNGSATIGVRFGTPPYTYLWMPAGQTTATASGLSAGIYTVEVTDYNGCTGTTKVTITQPSAVRDSFAVLHCNGLNGSATIGVKDGTTPYTFLWSPGGYTSASASGLSNGITYTVTITDHTGCSGTTLHNKFNCPTLPIIRDELSEPDTCCPSSHLNDVVVYPNPNNGIFTIQLPVVSGHPDSYRESVEIYDVLGQKVYSQFTIHNSPFTINLLDKSAGLYFYRVIGEAGNLLGEGKIVIQK